MVLTKDMRLGQRQRILSSWQSEQQHDQDIVSSFCPLPHPKFHRGKRWAYILGWDTGEEQYGEFIVFILSNKQTCRILMGKEEWAKNCITEQNIVHVQEQSKVSFTYARYKTRTLTWFFFCYTCSFRYCYALLHPQRSHSLSHLFLGAVVIASSVWNTLLSCSTLYSLATCRSQVKQTNQSTNLSFLCTEKCATSL